MIAVPGGSALTFGESRATLVDAALCAGSVCIVNIFAGKKKGVPKHTFFKMVSCA
jgi:hypothetical protein